jgi:branched-chain amino acid transport system substrate-binding protein
MSIIRTAAAFVAAGLVGLSAAATPLRAADQQPFEIPVILSLTGGGAFIGKELESTLGQLETSVNRRRGINGQPIHFQIYDDQTKPEVAVQLINSIVAKGSQVVLGPEVTNACLAVEPFVQNKIVQYCLSPGVDPPRGSYTFATSVSGPDIFAALVHYFKVKGWTRVAALTTSDATGQQADQRLGAAAALPENAGVEIIDREHFAPNDLTVAAQVSRIMAAKPDIVVAWVIGAPFVTALRGFNDAGSKLPMLASNSNMLYGQLQQWKPYLPRELYFSGPGFLGGAVARAQADAVRQFEAVTKDAGLQPDLPLALGWDPGLIIVSALQKLGTNATAEQIHSYIEELRGFPGIFGVYDFTIGNQRGLTKKDMTIMRWDPARLRWVAVSRPGGEAL